jgi:hypothetical protein
MLTTISSGIMSFITRTRYRQDIMAVLLLKVIGLFLLWFFFFANPIDHRLTRNQLTERYISSAS